MRTYDQTASAVRFLLGGIGTGNISLDQNARLTDFELFNRPNKGWRSPYTFFAVRTESPDGTVHAKALESQLQPPYDRSHGAHAWDVWGLPRFRHSEMSGRTPFATYRLWDDALPIEAGLEAFTPFIPLATDDSSLPVAVLRYTVRNLTDQPLTVSVAGSMSNLTTYAGRDIWTKPLYEGTPVTRYVERPELRGLHFTNARTTDADLDHVEFSLVTTETTGVTHLDTWNEGAWWDGLQDFWNDFTDDGALTPGRTLPGAGNAMHVSQIPMASLCVQKPVAPGETARFEFVLSWYHPNRVRSWDQCGCAAPPRPLVRNYYAKFGPPLETASYLIRNLARLEGLSRTFADALGNSTLPEPVLDAVSATLTVIRSTTCFRIEDGTFFGWEGCFDEAGCCDGNCTHVWNYAQALAFLFPDLERSLRRTEFLTETRPDGRMDFRARRTLGDDEWTWPPAADGQLGTIVRLYRDWRLSGDDGFLRELWPAAKRALEYAFTRWDTDGDGVLDGSQHNTYDIEFHGLTSLTNSIFFAALKAGEAIATYLGDTDSASRYADRRVRGARKLDDETYNGEFFEQRIDDASAYKYQYGTGCLADQVFGQQLAHVAGLGYVLDPDHVRSAIHAVARYNVRCGFDDVANLQRTYALNDETGLVLCTWPHGGRPAIPFPYCDEVWTGIEYQVASHLIYEGFVDEGVEIVAACRARHDGVKRNPWDEVECGHHYARSLASYAVLLALTGFHADAVTRTLTFRPATPATDFRAFFCCPAGWGTYHQQGQDHWIEPLYGDLSTYTVVRAD